MKNSDEEVNIRAFHDAKKHYFGGGIVAPIRE